MHFLPSGLSRITSGLAHEAQKEVMLGNHRLIDGLSHEAVENLYVCITHRGLFLLIAASAAVGVNGEARLPCQFGDLRSGYHHGWLIQDSVPADFAQAMAIPSETIDLL